MAKLIKNTGNVFDGFGFGGVSVPERETFYDKSMSRLNSLVERDSSLQRLRDVACQLMLADRQQEELINYVSGFIYDFSFSTGIIDNTGGIGGLSINSSGVKPFIKDVFSCQGAFSCRTGDGLGEYVFPFYSLPLPAFKSRFNGGAVPSNTFWFGFLSDIMVNATLRFGSSEPFFEVRCRSRLKPYTVFLSKGGSMAFTKLTDTSPFVSSDGRVCFDILNSEEMARLSVISGSPDKLKGLLKFSDDSAFSFVYVGMGIVFG